MTPPKKAAKTAPAAAPVEVQPLPEKGIGGRIKAARQRTENDLTIEALSRLCKLVDPVGQGIGRTALIRYESGEVLPGARELRILSEALDVSTDLLIVGRERKGVVDLGLALDTLKVVINERISKDTSRGGSLEDIFGADRPKLIAKAKQPQPRK